MSGKVGVKSESMPGRLVSTKLPSLLSSWTSEPTCVQGLNFQMRLNTEKLLPLGFFTFQKMEINKLIPMG